MARKYHCANCREDRKEEGLDRIAIGQNRFVVFCHECKCHVALEDPTILKSTSVPVVNPEAKTEEASK